MAAARLTIVTMFTMIAIFANFAISVIAVVAAAPAVIAAAIIPSSVCSPSSSWPLDYATWRVSWFAIVGP